MSKPLYAAAAAGVVAAAVMVGGVSAAETGKPASDDVVLPWGLDLKERPELPACTAEVIKKSDCHVHEWGTHIEMTKTQPDANRPHAAKEFELFMKAQHGR